MILRCLKDFSWIDKPKAAWLVHQFILLWTPFQGRLTISGRPESIERAKELVLLEVHPRG